MKTLCPTNECSLGHAILGFAAGFVPAVTVLVAGGFVAYELCRDKPAEAKVLSVAEFAGGWALSQIRGLQ